MKINKQLVEAKMIRSLYLLKSKSTPNLYFREAGHKYLQGLKDMKFSIWEMVYKSKRFCYSLFRKKIEMTTNEKVY